MDLTPIQKTFHNSSIFVTGSTGFIGALIVEKLLRATTVKRIFLLVRPKRNISEGGRLEKLFEGPEFAHVRSAGVNIKEKIQLISGNLNDENLGISEEDRSTLINEVNIVIHCGASVNFTEPLNQAVQVNVKATRDMLELATEIRNLKCFCHISTAFSNCNRTSEVIEEKLYKPAVPSKSILDSLKILNKLEPTVLNEITTSLLQDWPNTYTFTKQIAEDLVQQYQTKFPICIVRPSIVTAAINEPMEGFVNNFAALSGLLVATGVGLLRVYMLNPKVVLNIMPVDFVVNNTLAAIWDIVHKSQQISKRNIPTNPNNQLMIYNNTVNREENELTTKRFTEIAYCLKNIYGTSKFLIWYPCFIVTSNPIVFRLLSFLFHVVPVYLADFVLFCMGRKTWVVKVYKKNYKLLDVLQYFSTTDLHFATTNKMKLWNRMNSEDQNLFKFHSEINFYKHMKNYVLGLKTYALKDFTSNEEFKKKHRKYKALHGIVTGMFVMIWYFTFKFIVLTIISIFFRK